jgi:hypothetical protein
MATRTIRIRGIECENASDAFGWVDARGHGHVISIGNKTLVVDKAEAERVETLGVEFAYLHDHEMPDGTRRTISVLVNS